MVKVFHVKDWAVSFDSRTIPTPDSLLQVAEIDGDLNDAFSLTQNIEDAWAHTDNPKVRFNAPAGFSPKDCGARSTSVGDVMELDGKFYLVASVGFKELEGYALPVSS